MNVAFFIDGFNLYHSIDNSFQHNRYKWLDLKKLAENIADKEEIIKEVFYFTAYCEWNETKKQRHKKYVKALSANGVRVVKGNFQRTTRKFNSKMQVIDTDIAEKDLPKQLKYSTYEEKKTDVNIAVKLIEAATHGNYDTFYIISADSDYLSAIKYIKQYHPNIRLINVLPINAKGMALKQVCHKQIQLTEEELKKSLLPKILKIGKEQISIPKSYE